MEKINGTSLFLSAIANNMSPDDEDSQIHGGCRGTMTGRPGIPVGEPLPTDDHIEVPHGRSDNTDEDRNFCRGTVAGRYYGDIDLSLPQDEKSLKKLVMQVAARADLCLDEEILHLSRSKMHVTPDSLLAAMSGRDPLPRHPDCPKGTPSKRPTATPHKTSGSAGSPIFNIPLEPGEAEEFAWDSHKVRYGAHLLQKQFAKGANLPIEEELYGEIDGALSFLDNYFGSGGCEWVAGRFSPNLRETWVDLKTLRKEHGSFFKMALEQVEPLVTAKMGKMPDQKRKAIATKAILQDPDFALKYMGLRIQCAALSQMRDGRFARQMKGAVITLEGVLALFLTGDTEAAYDGQQKPVVNTESLHLGDTWLPYVADIGISTWPRARMGRRAHVVNYLLDEVRINTFLDGIYGGHEWMHDLINDLKRGKEEIWEKLEATVIADITPAADGSRVTPLSADAYPLGEGMIPAHLAIRQVLHDCLEETVCDVAARLSFGKSAARLILWMFSYLNTKGKDVMTEQVMARSSSRYSLTKDAKGRLRMELESHLPDFIRYVQLAFIYKVTGDHKEFRRLMYQANYTAGNPGPETISWYPPKDADPESNFPTLEVPVADLAAVMERWADVVINTPLEALNGHCLKDLMHYKEEVQGRKTDMLVAELKTGSNHVPEGVDFKVTNPGAAPVLALWEMMPNIKDADNILERLSDGALEMKFEIDRRAREKAKAHQAAAPKPDDPPHDNSPVPPDKPGPQG